MAILFFVSCFMFYDSTAAQVQLETGLPNIPGNRLDAGKELPQYINYLFIFGLGAITILALAQMMSGGIQYILAAGNVAQTAEAKNTIQQALLGLGLLLASYLLLNTINPDLVNLRNPNLTPAQFKGSTAVPPNTIGGGGESYQWTIIPMNKYCKDVLGAGWVGVGGNLCQPPIPSLSHDCCGYFPNNPK
ncbi:MAG: hypothetical protein Q7S78_02005 [Candidatus Azambacteria bacterium]|nr:hypothetical protein [Candidatus Azambacteria bacterium]